jgi:UDP-N-acetylmuramyl pentapeptide phosphotransferase/UDP-N-acetylglucosamine-1-phosphate transferase
VTTLVAAAAAVAAAVAVVATGLSLRAERLAERPDASSRRRRRGPANGSVLMVATAAGTLWAATAQGPSLRILAVAAALGVFGLVGDRRRFRPTVRVGAEVVAALAAVSLGVNTAVTATDVTDALVVVVVVVALVEATRLLDAAPRVSAAVLAPAAGALGLMAAGAGQDDVAVLAVALAAALAGMLVAGLRRPFWLGDSGCLFAGFVLAGLVASVEPATPSPLSLAVVLPVLTVPLLNLTVTAVDRLRRRRPLTQRRPDGLPHRLRAARLPWPLVLAVLGGAQVLIGAAAVAADRGELLRAAPLLAAAVVSLAVLALARGPVHSTPAPRLPSAVRLAGVGLVVAAGAFVLPAAVALAASAATIAEGAAAAEQGLSRARQGEVETAAAAFEQAQDAFVAADRRLRGPLTSLGLGVPVLGPNLAAARTLTGVGSDLVASGAAAAQAAPGDLRVSGGTVPLEEIRRLAPGLADTAATLRRAHQRTTGIEQAHLVPVVRDRLAGLDDRLDRTAHDADVAAMAAAVLPPVLGGDGPRHYFLSVENNAELRATGGFMGNFGELVADEGRLRLERLGRVRDLNLEGADVRTVEAPDDYLARYTRFEVATTWQNVNFSPDFPTVGHVISGLYPQSGGRSVDGVIGIDPVGLAAFLRLTGPVSVDVWPEAITADNVVEISLNQAYIVFEGDRDERVDFLGDVARAAVEAFGARDLGNPVHIVETLSDAVAGGHLRVWFPRDEEQALVERVGLAGEVEPVESDSVLVVNQNAGGNKLDYYLRRRSSYAVELVPSGDGVQVSGQLQVTLENTAPAEGLPRYIIGPYFPGNPAGLNRTYLSVYTPFELTGATLDGEPLAMEAEEELGRRVYSEFLDVPSLSSRTVTVGLQGEAPLAAGGWYELDLLHQPLLNPEEMSVTLEVPDGWRIAEAEGATLSGARSATTEVVLDRDVTVRVRIERG